MEVSKKKQIRIIGIRRFGDRGIVETGKRVSERE